MMMETMQPVLKNGRNVWDRINMPETEFQGRLKKIRKGMEKEGIDLLLLYGHGFNEYGNYCYLSNYIIRLPRGAMVVVPRKGRLALIFEGASRGIPSIKKTTWIEEIRASGDVSRECVKYLEEKKLIPCTIGFIGLRQLMPNDPFQFLCKSLSQSKLIDGDHLLREMRMLKSEREIDQIRRSSRIIVHAFNFIAGAALSEMNERILEARLRREVRLEGAEDFRMLIAKPRDERWAFRPAQEQEISSGETVILHLAIQWERYWAEATRTFILKGSSFAEPQFEPLRPLYERMVNGLRPGKKASQFYKETMTEIKKEGLIYIPDYGLGQGIGLSPQEFPVISGKENTLLREGMIFSLRLLIKDKNMGAVMIGDTIHLTREGPKILTRHPSPLPSKGREGYQDEC
jgi:Xaa-Pro dipeptidase